MNRPLSECHGKSSAAVTGPPRLLPALALGFVAYACSINNGFISDDFVILGRVGAWLGDFSTFEFPPEGNRLTLYAWFAAMRGVFGFHSELYYPVAILLHLVNVWLFGRLLWLLTGRKDFALLGAVAFAVIQNPQEAVMWLSGVGDVLVGVFTLAALHAWARGRYLWSSVAFAAALLSKESGLVFLALAPLLDWTRSGKLRFRREYLFLLPPTAGFLALFLATMRSNTYLSGGLYSFGPLGALTILNSAHRLAFPWLYLALLAALAGRRLRGSRQAALFACWVFVGLAPYSFITYQNHVPSRSQYLAAMGVAGLLALLVESVPGVRLRTALAALFALVNIGYLWGVKDVQYLRRAAPTSRLIEELRRREPRELGVAGFPLNPWIAREATKQVPGWRPEMLRLDGPCRPDCVRLRWNGAVEQYETAAIGPGLRQ